ncbi:MAG: hypothetical protein SPI36_03360 [Candidatus Onthovivens sp.]|nr:hypothetical protein [Candidatus Onthovivens sp.]MDY6058268.1 hypothetical protein [Candidatus Onthovivens sp.]
MKTIEKIIYKNGEEESIGNRKVSNITFYDLQTKGPIAKKNLLRTLKEEWIDIKEVAQVVIDGVYIDLY